jgi:hypothetical protein
MVSSTELTVEGRALVQQQVCQLVAKALRISRRAEVTGLHTPVVNPAHHATDQLAHAVFALGRTDVTAEVLRHHDVRRQLRPGAGHLDIGLLEDGVTPLVGDLRRARLPFDAVVRVGPGAREVTRDLEALRGFLALPRLGDAAQVARSLSRSDVPVRPVHTRSSVRIEPFGSLHHPRATGSFGRRSAGGTRETRGASERRPRPPSQSRVLHPFSSPLSRRRPPRTPPSRRRDLITSPELPFTPRIESSQHKIWGLARRTHTMEWASRPRARKWLSGRPGPPTRGRNR